MLARCLGAAALNSSVANEYSLNRVAIVRRGRFGGMLVFAGADKTDVPISLNDDLIA